MAIKKETVYDLVQVTAPHRIVQVRKRVNVVEDGTVIASKIHRYTLSPGADLTNEPELVRSVCNAVWTTIVIENFATATEAQNPQFTGGEVVQEDNPFFTPGT